MNDNLLKLIKWFREIQGGGQPKIPYNLHRLVRALHDNLGTNDTLDLLESLYTMKDDEE